MTYPSIFMSVHGLLLCLLCGKLSNKCIHHLEITFLSQCTSSSLPYCSAIDCQGDGHGMWTPTFDLTHYYVVFATLICVVSVAWRCSPITDWPKFQTMLLPRWYTISSVRVMFGYCNGKDILLMQMIPTNKEVEKYSRTESKPRSVWCMIVLGPFQGSLKSSLITHFVLSVQW